MSTLLVIGGSGFFGKSILDGFKRGLLQPWKIDKVIIFARNADNLRISNPDILGDKVSLINGDIGICDELPYADYVIHAAASTDAARYLSLPQVEKKNILSAVDNYGFLARNFHRASSILYVSSGAVYGQQSQDTEEVAEDAEFKSIDEMDLSKVDYAYAKREAENIIMRLGADGYRVAIARCFSFVGKYLPLNQHFAIGNFILDGLKNRAIVVNAKHSVIRSYMYADDLIVWMMKILENSSTNCPIFNVGSDEAVNLFDLAEIIALATNVKASYAWRDKDRVDRYVPSIQKAKKQLGVGLQYSLVDSINLTIDNVRIKK